MQITINVNAPELAQAIQSLSAALSAANSIMSPTQPQVNTVTPQQEAQEYSAPVSQAPIQQAPVNQAPVQQQAPAQEQPAQQSPTAPIAPTAPTSAPTYDFNQLASATMQLQQAGQNIFELFGQFGIQALNQLPKERYGEYANALRDRGAKL